MHRPRARRFTPFLLLAFLTLPASACLWDYDTLRDERRGMPGIAEVLAGQWEKHSNLFYEHRIAEMKSRLAQHPDDLAAYDNLAVAHEKLGDHDAAIAVMLDKEEITPGQYTTYANLGTFYLHKGQFDPGIRYIEKALQINPSAHFGREEYQLKLAKFLQAAAAQPATAPASQPSGAGFPSFLGVNFQNPGMMPETWRSAYFRQLVFDKLHLKDNVFDGIVGILRFGTGQSAELYYVLGELLAAKGQPMLAYRAYRRAVELHHPHADEIRSYMDQVRDQAVHKRAFDDDVINDERAAAARWVKEYQAFEDNLVRSGKDTTDERNYAPFYATHSRELPQRTFIHDYYLAENNDTKLWLLLLSVVAVMALAVSWKLRRRKKLRLLSAGG